jgi:hypothetical protein
MPPRRLPPRFGVFARDFLSQLPRDAIYRRLKQRLIVGYMRESNEIDQSWWSSSVCCSSPVLVFQIRICSQVKQMLATGHRERRRWRRHFLFHLHAHREWRSSQHLRSVLSYQQMQTLTAGCQRKRRQS